MKRFHFKIYTGPCTVREVSSRLATTAQGGWWSDFYGTEHVYVIVECMTEAAAALDVRRWLTLAGFPASSGLRPVLYKQTEVVVGPDPRLDPSRPKCQWFARCNRAATTTTPHPILGDVPTCDHCHDFAVGGR